MKKLIVSLFAGMLVGLSLEHGAAQELLIAPEGMETEGAVPDLALPPESVNSSTADTSDTVIGTETLEEELLPFESGPGHMYLCDAGFMESTGTWLRRGFWYAEVDAVIFNRKWNRFSRALAFQPMDIDPFGRLVANELLVEPHEPGAEGSARLTVGHFLFRDHHNRDHVAEFTILGGGQWTQEAGLMANPNNNGGTTVLQVPNVIDGGQLSFDGATNMDFRYDGRINSFELNYLVKDRMGNDRLELEPSGHWVRRAGSGFTRHFLAGVRFVDITDDFVWTATGIDPDGDPNTPDNVDDDNGSLLTNTDNDMLGTQVGFGATYETARWSAGIECKGGMFLNIIDLDNTFALTQNLDGNNILESSSRDTDELSFIGEAAMVGKWHLRPNFSLRASLEILFATSVAYAPSQFPGAFIPGGPPKIDTGGESTFLGGAIGFEGYW